MTPSVSSTTSFPCRCTGTGICSSCVCATNCASFSICCPIANLSAFLRSADSNSLRPLRWGAGGDNRSLKRPRYLSRPCSSPFSRPFSWPLPPPDSRGGAALGGGGGSRGGAALGGGGGSRGGAALGGGGGSRGGAACGRGGSAAGRGGGSRGAAGGGGGR